MLRHIESRSSIHPFLPAITFGILLFLVAVLGEYLVFSWNAVVVRFVPALVAVGGLLLGPLAVLGAITGYLAYLLMFGLLEPVALWETVGFLLLGYAIYELWGRLGPLSSGHPPRLASVEQALEFTAVALLAALYASVIVGWGYALTAQLRFFPGAPLFLLNTFLSVALVGGVFLGLFTFAADRIPELARAAADGAQLENVDRIERGMVLIPLAWLLIGSTLAIGVQMIELIPEVYFYLYDVEFLLFFKRTEIIGPGASRLQAVLGAVILVAWVVYLRRIED